MNRTKKEAAKQIGIGILMIEAAKRKRLGEINAEEENKNKSKNLIKIVIAVIITLSVMAGIAFTLNVL